MIKSIFISHYHTVRIGNEVKETEPTEVIIFLNDESETIIFPPHLHKINDEYTNISGAVSGSIVDGVFKLENHNHNYNKCLSEKTFYTVNMKYGY